MSPEELYQWAIDRAQDAVTGGKAAVAKLQEHLEAKQAWLGEQAAELARLEEMGLDGFLRGKVDSGELSADEVRAPAGVAEAGAGA